MRSLFAKERIIKSFPQRETQHLSKGNKTLLVNDPVVGSCSVYQDMQTVMDINLQQGQSLCLKTTGESGFYINSDSMIAVKGSYLNSMSGEIRNFGSHNNVGVATCSATQGDFCYYEIKSDTVAKASLFKFKFIDEENSVSVDSNYVNKKIKTHVAVKNNYERIVSSKRVEHLWNSEFLVYINPFGSTATSTQNSGNVEYVLNNYEEIAQNSNNKIRSFSVDTVQNSNTIWSTFDISGKFTATGNDQSAEFNTFDNDVEKLRFYSAVSVNVGLCKRSDYLDLTKVVFGTIKQQKITATKPLCVLATDIEVFYINSPKPVKITGKTEDKKDIGSVENAYLFTTSGAGISPSRISYFYFEISTTEDQDIEIYGSNFGSSQDSVMTLSTVAILKSNYEGQFDIGQNIGKIFNVFNPNGADVTASSTNNLVHFTDPLNEDTLNSNIVNTKVCFIQSFIPPDPSAPESKITITVNGKSNTIQLPEKVINLKPLTIYAYESADVGNEETSSDIIESSDESSEETSSDIIESSDESSEETSSDIIESSDESSEETSSDIIESSDEGNEETNNDLKENADGGNEGLPKSAVIGIASGVSVLVIIIIVITVTIICIKKKNSQKVYNEQETSESSNNTQKE